MSRLHPVVRDRLTLFALVVAKVALVGLTVCLTVRWHV